MSLFIVILIDGISYAAWLFLVSIGLTLVFGVMRLLNVAHGGFYSFGAYTAAFTIGLCSAAGLGTGWQFTALAIAALLVGGLLGLIIERIVLVRLYRRDEVLVLFATYAVFLILEDLTKLIWGGRSLYANQPRDALGQIAIGSLAYPLYDITLILIAVVLASLISFFLSSTRIGRCVTAVVTDKEISAAMGIDVQRILIGTFVVGAALGALAGAVTAPKIAILPGIGVEVIVLAFAVVVVGGLGSISGALIGAALIGLVRAITSHLLPEAELFVIYGVMTTVLAFRPHGLFAPIEARKI